MARRNCWWLPRSAILPWSSTTIWPTLPGPSRWWVMNRTDRPSVACSRSAVSAWRARCAGSSACGVVPGVPLGQQPVRLLRPPGPAGIRVDGRDVTEHRVHDPPGGLDGVLPGEKHTLPVQRGADQPVVRALVAAGPLGERQVLGLRLPARTGLFAREPEGDRGLGPDPEPQLVVARQRGQPEDVARRMLEPDSDLSRGDRHGLADADHDRYPGPPPRVGLQLHGDEGLHGRFRGDAFDVQVALVLAADGALGGQWGQRLH